MNDRVRIGIIGTGVGLRTLHPGFAQVPGAEVVGLVGSSPERASQLAEGLSIRPFASARELCESSDVDLVCVASPNEYHYRDVLCALENRKHVLAEKPLALTQTEISSLVEAARDAKRIAVVDHQLRFNPYLREIRDVIRRGDLGRLYYVRIHQQGISYSDLDVPWSWSFDAARGGGVRLAMASHLIDLFRFWTGEPRIYSVSAGMDVVIDRRTIRGDREVPVRASSFFSVDLACENMRVQMSATAAAFSASRFDCELFGTEGELRFDLHSKLRGSFRSRRGTMSRIAVQDVFPDEASNEVSLFAGSFRYFAPVLVDAIRSGDDTRLSDASSFVDALQNQIILDAMLESARRGHAVVLNSNYSSNAEI